MSAAIDANVLIYACIGEHPLAERAQRLISEIATGGVLFLPWPSLFAFLRVSTNPRVFEPPLSPARAMEVVDELLALPGTRTLGETQGFWRSYRTVAEGLQVRANLVPDAHLAALLLANGVQTLYTNDADFRRFDFLDVRNPFR